MSSPARATGYSTYSPAETKLIQIAFKHMKGIPDCDWDAIATEYGYKNAAIARAKYGIAMNKYKSAGATTDGAPTVTPAAKAPTRKRKAPGDTPNGGTKRGRKPKGLSAVEVQDNEDDAEVAEEKIKVEAKEEAATEDGSESEAVGKEEEEA
ncbi:hypothetical protein MMC11_001145 [Xylographa trunciseda]|nr:hypothetical protein [Xylographa trunciseda]